MRILKTAFTQMQMGARTIPEAELDGIYVACCQRTCLYFGLFPENFSEAELKKE